MAIKLALPGILGSCGVSGVVATGCYVHSSGYGLSSSSISKDDKEESGVSSGGDLPSPLEKPQSEPKEGESLSGLSGDGTTNLSEVDSADPSVDQLQQQATEETGSGNDVVQSPSHTESSGLVSNHEQSDSQRSDETSDEDQSRSGHSSSCGWVVGIISSWWGGTGCNK